MDVEAYIHRSPEVRHQEQARFASCGKVKKPLNAFMLWRRANRDRIRAASHERDPRPNFSTICGELWLVESTAVRVQFKEWAEIEKRNHLVAFPDYKFGGSKNGAAKRRRLRAGPQAALVLDDPTDSGPKE
ncbi:hypothetical protein PG994_015139 [Apiospora phragmitis]|uniref:HMG box domain-containing protein n=1 Tax=Apiospora phragmitis TaxID=2905665 RepID=A0ABR1SVL7_9PEZI